MMLFELQLLDSLSFSLTVHVHKIILKDGTVFYESNITAPNNQHMTWSLDGKIWDKVKSAHPGKLFYSSIYGKMFCLGLFRDHSSNSILFALKLCAFPRGRSEMILSGTMTARAG